MQAVSRFIFWNLRELARTTEMAEVREVSYSCKNFLLNVQASYISVLSRHNVSNHFFLFGLIVNINLLMQGILSNAT